jgi:hypothetical protein
MRVFCSASIGSINAVYFAIEIENATLRADAKERLASTTAGDVGFATEFRESMGSAAYFERFVRGHCVFSVPAARATLGLSVGPSASMR